MLFSCIAWDFEAIRKDSHVSHAERSNSSLRIIATVNTHIEYRKMIQGTLDGDGHLKDCLNFYDLQAVSEIMSALWMSSLFCHIYIYSRKITMITMV